MTTPVEATDAICKLLNDAWAAEAPQHNGGDVPPVEWPNVKQGGPKLSEGVVPWAKLKIEHTGGDQATFGPRGQRRMARWGELTVQVFVPAGERGLELAGLLGKVALNAYEGSTLDGVRFRRVGLKDVGEDGAWYQVNVTAHFEYDEAG